MLFASTALAARIERAECRLLADSAAAAEKRRPGSGVFAMRLAGGMATFTASGSPLNKVAGLGLAGPLAAGQLEAVEKAFAERGSPVQAEVSSLADPSVVRLLAGRGYVLQGFENVSGQSLPADIPTPTPSGLEIAV
ncbi:MAG TPA: GNAT family N-acetyltransferase, partial [Vicinamibacteria bacterium]